MTKRNTLSVFIVVIVLALVAAITVLSLYFTGCFSETRDEPLPSPVGFEVTVGNNSYTSDVSGLVLTSGESIRILSESSKPCSDFSASGSPSSDIYVFHCGTPVFEIFSCRPILGLYNSAEITILVW